MTDSEDEREIPDHVSIARATESALICALAPIVCLQGMQKVRKTVRHLYMLSNLHATLAGIW